MKKQLSALLLLTSAAGIVQAAEDHTFHCTCKDSSQCEWIDELVIRTGDDASGSICDEDGCSDFTLKESSAGRYQISSQDPLPDYFKGELLLSEISPGGRAVRGPAKRKLTTTAYVVNSKQKTKIKFNCEGR